MRGRRLMVLALVVVALGAYIWFYERHQPTTGEVKERADKLLPELEKDQVKTIDITRGRDHLVLVKKNGAWRLPEPMDYPAEESAVDALLAALENLKVERSLAPGEVDPKAYGLDAPGFIVKLVTETGPAWTLEVGQEEPLGNNRAVTLDGTTVKLVPKWFVSDLDKDLDGWRSHDVVDIFEDQVASLDIEAGKDRIEVVRDGTLWRLLEPLQDLADRDHLRNLISDLNALRVVQFIDDPSVTPGQLGLDHPRYRVKIVRTEGKAPVLLEFGARSEEKGEHRVACRRDGKELFWVTDRAEVRLGKAPVLWRSKVVYPFDSWDVEALTVSSGGATTTVERSDSGWTCDGHEAASSEIFSRLSTLSRLEARGFDLVKGGTEELGTITVRLKPGQVGEEARPAEVTWTFYTPMKEGGRALVAVTGRDTLMSVEMEKVNGLLEDPEGLCKPLATPTPEPTPAAKKPEEN